MDLEATVNTDLQAARPLSHPPEPGDHRIMLREIVCEEVCGGCQERHLSGLLSIVLTGSLVRDEATFIRREGLWELLGDAEFLLVFDENVALPGRSQLGDLEGSLEEALLRRGLRGQAQLIAVHPSYLRGLRPHIFAYELRTRGRAVWGRPDVLALIPEFRPAAISREDAWRLLCNRMIEQLEVSGELVDRSTTLTPEVLYRTVKLYLDLATSYLVFAGAYEPSYRSRAEALANLAARAQDQNSSPFPLDRLAERVRLCTEIKLNGACLEDTSTLATNGGVGYSFWEEAIGYARLLWRWELALLTNTQGQSLNGALLQKWMKRQAPSQRLRGWLYVLRHEGWHRSWKNWPRWVCLASKGSPRYCVYAAASELFFRLPCLLKQAGQRPHVDLDCRKVRAWLPVASCGRSDTGLPEWQKLAADITGNYKEFLTGTRS